MSHEMHHFSLGVWVLFLAYAVSALGSLVGLLCVQQAMSASDRRSRGVWTGFAALSIGGVAVWLMHFIGMMGFDLPGTTIRYSLMQTLLSVGLAIGPTFLGLAAVGSGAGRGRVPRLLGAGLVMGLAVSAMHYTGMWAIRIRGSIEHETGYVLASIAIGVTAATAALWFSQVATRWYLQIPSALVMGLAVVALHYTGMAGLTVHIDPTAPAPVGLSVNGLLFPGFGVGIVVLAVLVVKLLVTPSRRDASLEAQIAGWETPVPAAGVAARP
ncbi:MHYT domain-containing protein [Rhodococcus sp. NPDC058532]|uniref:MHYT domain-containing protein n=1 Tax=Rhodococcus sp. NPDC058532 TaxID=3346540 RepID=UPI003669A24F